MAPGILILVSIPCHIEPDMRFSLIRLSDNLLPAAFKGRTHIFPVGRKLPIQVEKVKHERPVRSSAHVTLVGRASIVPDDLIYSDPVAGISVCSFQCESNSASHR